MFVSVVEPGELAYGDDHRDRGERQQSQAVASDNRDRDDEGEDGGADIAEGQQSPVDGVPGSRGAGRLPLTDPLQRRIKRLDPPRGHVPPPEEPAIAFGGSLSRLDRNRAVSSASKSPPVGG